MNETPSAKKKEPMQMPEKNPRTSKKQESIPMAMSFRILGNMTFPTLLCQIAHTEM